MYCIIENCVFRASPKHSFQKCNTRNSKCLRLHISAIPPSWFAKFPNRFGGIAKISNSRCFVQRVVHMWKSFVWGALKTPFPKVQYLSARLLDFLWIHNTSEAKTANIIIKRAQIFLGAFDRGTTGQRPDNNNTAEMEFGWPRPSGRDNINRFYIT